MFAFVIWAVGLWILLWLARMNVALIAVLFDGDHWFLGFAVAVASVFGWLALIAAIL